MTLEDLQKQEKIVNEEHKIWKKNVPFLYDALVLQAMSWPSLTVQWLPGSIPYSSRYSYSELLLGTHTSRNDLDYVKIAKVALPTGESSLQSPLASNCPADKFQTVTQIVHEGEVNKARYNPAAPSIIATQTISGEIMIFDRPQSAPVARLQHHSKEGWGLEWSPHRNNQLLAGSDDTLISLWDVESNSLAGQQRPLRVFSHHTATVNDLAWSHFNPSLFASVAEDVHLKYFDLRSPANAPVIDIESASDEPANSISFNPLNKYLLATGAADGRVSLWDLRRPEHALRHMSAHMSDVSCVAWSPHAETILASGGYDRKVNLWDISLITDSQGVEHSEDGGPELLFMHGGHTNKISDLSWHPELPWVLASTAEDNVLQVWSPASHITNPTPDTDE